MCESERESGRERKTRKEERESSESERCESECCVHFVLLVASCLNIEKMVFVTHLGKRSNSSFSLYISGGRAAAALQASLPSECFT